MPYNVCTQTGLGAKPTTTNLSETFLGAVRDACSLAEGMVAPPANTIVSVYRQGSNFPTFSIKWVQGRGWVPET